MISISFHILMAISLLNGVFSRLHQYHSTTLCGEQSTKDLYYVYPDGNSSLCSTATGGSLCKPLSFYTQNASSYFKSNTTFCFLGGHGCFQHNTSVVTVNDISVLRIIGSTKNSTICCRGSDNAGFVFLNVKELQIENLTLDQCGQKYNDSVHITTPVRSALLCSYGENHTLTNVHIQNSLDQNIYYISVEGFIRIQNCSFTNATDEQSNAPYIAGNSFFFNECNSPNTSLLIKNTKFLNNSNRWKARQTPKKSTQGILASGLFIVLKCTDVNVTLIKVTLDKNKGYSGGNLAVNFFNISHLFMNPVHIYNSTITNGEANVGGGIYIDIVEASALMEKNCEPSNKLHTVLVMNNTNVISNTALHGGGGLYLQTKESQTYCRVAKISIDNCRFQNNTLGKHGRGGVAIHSANYLAFEYVQHAQPQFHFEITNSNFSEHIVRNNMSSGRGVIFAKASPNVHLNNVLIYNNNCSGILGVKSAFVISGNVNISYNNGSSGGGILFCSDTVMFLSQNTNLTIAHNRAIHAGGGICVEIECLQSLPMCFFQLDKIAAIHPESSIKTIRVYLTNNTAGYAGDDLYGGSIDYCYLLDSPYHNVTANESLPVFKQLFRIASNNSSNIITSPPRHVCLCNTTEDRCSVASITKEVFPGEEFYLPVVLVGELNGTVPGIVEASIITEEESEQKLKPHKINKTCTNIPYTVYSDLQNLILKLKVQIIGDESFVDLLEEFSPLLVNVSLKKCPIGFKLTPRKEGGYNCTCVSAFKNVNCCINNQSLTFNKPLWIGYQHDSHTYLVSHGIPLDYLLPNDPVIVNASKNSLYQDMQCVHNRAGILCGKCSENYSVILGTSECRNDCTNSYLTLMLVFILAGILLVSFITLLNLTVAEGTVSGLIFYANIIQVHRPVLFQYDHYRVLTTFLLIFVSWINLDLGFPACFYDGMDDYSKAWLQFLFPIYIWMISGVIIVLSRKYNAFAKLLGNNGVKVLATLILLSYSKMLRTIISTAHFQTIEHYSTNESINITVKHVLHWKPDGNILFLQGKHIPLFIIGAVFTILCLPFTFTLLCIQNLQKISNRRCFTWVWRLKPFFDTYTGPYSKRSKFWPGLLLLTRVFLYTMSAVNYNYGVQVTNVFATIVVCTILFVIAWKLQPRVYERKALDSLESSFLLNLSFLCTGTAYTIYDERHAAQTVLAHISVLVAFLTFLGILIYHMYIKCKLIWKNKCQQTERENPNVTITTSEVNITERQGLNNYPPFIRFDQDREPLLATESEENTKIN